MLSEIEKADAGASIRRSHSVSFALPGRYGHWTVCWKVMKIDQLYKDSLSLFLCQLLHLPLDTVIVVMTKRENCMLPSIES